MRLDRAGILANILLVLTVGLLAVTAWTASPTSPPGDSVAQPRAAGDDARVVIVAVPGWSWADIDASTPTLRALERTSATASVVDRGPAAADGADPAGGSLPGQLDVLRRTLERQGSCLTDLGGLRHDAAAVPDDECPVRILWAEGSGRAALDREVADLLEGLPRQSMVVLTGYSGAGEGAGAHPLLVTTPTAAEADSTGSQLRSASTRRPGLVRPADLVATVLVAAGSSVPDSLGGAAMTSAPSAGTDARTAHRDLAIEVTLVSRATAPYLTVLALWLAAALVAAGVYGWRRGTPHAREQSRMALSVAGSAVAALGVSGYAAAGAPWWRLGTGPSTDPETVGLVMPLLALLVATLVAGTLVLVVAWAPWIWWVQHRLVPVAVVMAVTVVVIGLDVLRGAHWGLGAVFGLQPLVTGRFYGLSTLTYGLLGSAAMLLGACVASLLIRPRRPRTVPVIAVVLVGLSVAFVVGAPEGGADVGGVPALLVGTFLLATAAAGRRLAASSVFLALLVTGAVVGVVMVADWMRPVPDRTTLGRLVQQALEGRAWAGLTSRVDGAVEVATSEPAAWLVLLGLALWSYAVLARRSAAHQRIRALWDYPLMHACATTLLVVWVLGGLLNEPGLALVASGLTLTAGVVLCVVARGRAGVSAASPGG
jgi:hypothetical protein